MDDRLMVEFKIVVRKDDEAGVWCVTSCNVPGLNLEDADPWELIARAVDCAPELIELNDQ